MPTKWNKQFQSELDGIFDEGLCNASTPVGDAYDMSETFKQVSKDTFKRYFYKKRKEFAADASANAGGTKIPDSKYSHSLFLWRIYVFAQSVHSLFFKVF